MFVIIGLVLFTGTIYFVGKQKNLFGSTFKLKAQFKTVSGLKEGNNVRFSGINVGTVDGIELITDTTVMVYLVIKKSVQKFIKKNAIASIGSDGLMGDKVLTISPVNGNAETVSNNSLIASKSAVEMADVMNSLKTSVDNAGIITGQLAQVSLVEADGIGTTARHPVRLGDVVKEHRIGVELKSALEQLDRVIVLTQVVQVHPIIKELLHLLLLAGVGTLGGTAGPPGRKEQSGAQGDGGTDPTQAGKERTTEVAGAG